MNYVFVDFENVTDLDLSLIGNKSVSFTLLIGAKQTKLDVDLVQKMFEHSTSVQLIRLTSSGKNALDFTLAYYLGRAVEFDPQAYFHIVSRDTGFEPLIEHLHSRHLRVRRHEKFHELMFTHPAKSETTSAPPSEAKNPLFQRALEHIQKNDANRPKRKKTLLNNLRSSLGKTTSETEVERVIEALIRAKHLEIDAKGAVTYRF